MITGTEPTDQDSTLRHQVETIAIAVSKITGRPRPDPAMIEDIRSETERLLVHPSAAKPHDRLSLLIVRVIAKLR